MTVADPLPQIGIFHLSFLNPSLTFNLLKLTYTTKYEHDNSNVKTFVIQEEKFLQNIFQIIFTSLINTTKKYDSPGSTRAPESFKFYLAKTDERVLGPTPGCEKEASLQSSPL